MKIEGYPRRIDSVARPPKRARRLDGICPTCNEREKQPGYSYCRPCNTVRNYDRRKAKELLSGKPQKRPGWPKLSFEIAKPILQMLADGLISKQIAFKVGIPTKTLWNRLKWLRKYARVKTDCQLCVWAVRNGHVSFEAPTRIAPPVTAEAARSVAP